MSSPAALADPRPPRLAPPGGAGGRRVGDPDLVGFGAAIALLPALLIATTFALYPPAADDLWPFALAAAALGVVLVAAGWFGTAGSER